MLSGVSMVKLRMVWHLGFRLTPAHERKNVELRLKQIHTTNIVAALLKRSVLCGCLIVVPFSKIMMFPNVVALI